jgi:hypothetical protein
LDGQIYQVDVRTGEGGVNARLGAVSPATTFAIVRLPVR